MSDRGIVYVKKMRGLEKIIMKDKIAESSVALQLKCNLKQAHKVLIDEVHESEAKRLK